MCDLSHKLPNDLRLRKLGNYKKIPGIPGFDDKDPADHPKSNILRKLRITELIQ